MGGVIFSVTSTKGGKRVGKMGFVEQRSFWNLFRSFDKLWIMLILFLHATSIVALEEKEYPWQALKSRNVQAKVLTVFITWSGLRFLLSLLDAGMQYSLVLRETLWPGVRMVLKSVVAATCIVLFGVLYGRIWTQRNNDGKWSGEAKVQTSSRLHWFMSSLSFWYLRFFYCPRKNFIENNNWRIFYLLSWWFQSRTFVGRGLGECLVDNIKYTISWVVVLAIKFCFSYFLLIKPMVNPTQALLSMKDVNYEWHQFFGDSNRFAVGLLWLPVVLIYLTDIHFWYSIYSLFVGIGVGLFQHLGEIRNMQQLRLRFHFFASVIQFNLMPGEQLLNARGTLKSKFQDAINRLKPFKKLESNQVEANKFVLIWNEIILTFREEEILSDQEVELLELPQNTWNVRFIRWPCLLLCNELLLAPSQAKELVDAPDKWLWYKICKNEYRHCAVIEAYDFVKHLLLQIVKYNTVEHSIVAVLFQEIDHSLLIEKLTKTFKMTVLPQIHAKLISLLDLIIKPKKDLSKIVNTLQAALYEVAIRDFFKEKRNTDQLREDGLAPSKQVSSEGLLFENAVELRDTDNSIFAYLLS